MNVLVGDLAEWWPTPYGSVHISFTITILLLDLSLLYFNQMIPQLTLLSLKLNSSLKPLLPTLLWMILDIFLLLLYPLTTSSLKLKFFIMMFSRPSLALILGRLTIRMESLHLFSKTVLPNTLTAWSNSFVYVSLLLPILLARGLLTFPKKGDRSNFSNYGPITLISCFSKAFESVTNKKIMRHLSAHNLHSDCRYGFRKGQSIGCRDQMARRYILCEGDKRVLKCCLHRVRGT